MFHLLELLVEHDLQHYILILALVYGAALLLCTVYCMSCCCPRSISRVLGVCSVLTLAAAIVVTVALAQSAERHIEMRLAAARASLDNALRIAGLDHLSE